MSRPPAADPTGVGRRTALVWAACLAVGACGQPTAPDPAVEREAGWRTDLLFLDSLVPAVHPAVPSDPDFSAFHRAIESLSTRVRESTDEQVGAEIQRILVAVGDGHTTLVPDDVGPISFLALMADFYWFDDGVHVVSVRPGFGELQGGRVSAIGGVPVEDVMERLMPLVPRDNRQSGRWLGGQLMQYTSVLRAAGIEAPDQGTTLTLELAGGGAAQVTVPAHDRAALPRLNAPGEVGASTPRYLRANDVPYWLEPLGDSVLYVNFNSVRDGPAESLARFAETLGGLLRTGAFNDVILDIRFNNGGDNTLLPPLLTTLQDFDEAGEGNRIYAIIGRATFSAGQNFATRLERTTRVTFVGEASGGRPNHVGDAFEARLPYSGLFVSVASRRYDDAGPGDMREAIEPDVPVAVNAADYFGNRDPAFDTVMTLVRERRR